MMTKSIRSLLCVCSALACAALGCGDAHRAVDPDDTHDDASSAATELSPGSTVASVPGGPWGACGPAVLAEPVPQEVIATAEAALLPGGFVAEAGKAPDFVDPSNCREATLGTPFRLGMVYASKLNGARTPDDFLEFFDHYKMAWFCDGIAAGAIEVNFRDKRWSVAGAGTNKDWMGELIRDAKLDPVPTCTRGVISQPPLGNWLVLADDSEGAVIVEVGRSLYTREQFIERLSSL